MRMFLRSLIFCPPLLAFILPARLHAGETPREAPFYVRKSSDPATRRPDAAVKWSAPSPAVLANAARGNKLLFLFVTAEWIQAGKEMERVTFGDVEIATRLNEEFVPIQIDRDVYPDLDFRLQQAVAAVSGARGWPVCAFATPDGHVFAGGTFFPPDDDPVSQKAGLRSVIFQVVRAWREQRDGVQKAGESVTAELGKTTVKPALNEIPSDLLKGAFEGLCAEQETAAGRRAGTVVLFPAPRALEAGFLFAERTRDGAARGKTLRILDAMLSGGMYDVLQGGFFRCSTDGDWRVPRFEKLLIQNVEMLRALGAAWRVTGDARYLNPALQTAAFLRRNMVSGRLCVPALAGGASEISDGDFYTWTVADIEQLISQEALQSEFVKTFELREWGSLPAAAPHRNVLPNVLHRTDIEDGLRQRMGGVLEILARARVRRPAPRISGAPCIDGNAYFAAALMELGDLKGGLELLAALLPYAGTHAVGADAKPLAPALLADEAALALACASAYEATGEGRYEMAGVACLERIEKDFLDAKDGTFFDRPGTPALFPAVGGRIKIYADTWEPSPLGQTALAFLKWSVLLDRPAYWMRAKQCVLGCGEITEGLGHYGASLAIAADWLKHGGVTVTLVAKPGAPEADALWRAAQESFAPGKVIRRAALPDAGAVPGIDVSKTPAYGVVERNGKRVLTADAEVLRKAIRE